MGRGVSEGLLGAEKDFKMYSVFDEKPLKVLEDRGDVV